ncbi:unnamed protein product [Cylicocyclus nassatus]|uniref:Methyltransferase domain-containing protein n=1 Tax=Cylicocyclus nassatus TaxID=53992 RepID=A0AA36DM52_CYLNA|nr:unnamed protein product [Cylicocyclus nassatus]
MAEKTELQKKLMQIGIDGMLSAAIALGNRLNLFAALAKVGSEKEPATAAQVAEVAGCKERYVREWLATMATADIISVTEDEKYFIKEKDVEDLLLSSNVKIHSFLPIFLRPFDKLCKVYKKNGPYGLEHDDFTMEFYDIIANFSEALHSRHLIPDLLPAISSDLKERLEKGDMMCLDVGCGRGFHAAFLADNFPKSNFTGIDVTLEAVHMANQKRKDNGQTYENLSFVQMDGAKMDDDWSDKFDLVTIFDACHDQMRPDLCLKEIHRVLKPGGLFGMVEVDGTSNVLKDKQEMGDLAAAQYAYSVFHCLPTASNSEDALGLGTMWGKEKAVKMLKEAGFNDVKVIPTPYFDTNVLTMAEKTDFQKKILQIGIDGMISASIALGIRLHLFEALAKVGSEDEPATAEKVAEESDCKERYVREWLAVMGTADIITVTEDEKFFIRKENIEDLTTSTDVHLHSLLPNSLRPYDKLCKVFKKDGPYGLDYSDFTPEFYEVMANLSEAMHRKHLISDFLPALGSDIKERLEEGGMMCLDVGCGKGFHSALLAENFPKSNFTGIDCTLDAVHMANQKRKDNGETFDNLAFLQMDGGKLSADWTDKFDLVIIFDACHDQKRPDLCLKEIYRVLKSGGVFGMVEVDGTSNIYKDKQEMGYDAALQYADSIFHCLPAGSNSEDALCLGAMWGKERAVKMLKEAGFNDVSVIPTPYFETNVLYVCKKD